MQNERFLCPKYHTNNQTINAENGVKLLGIEIGNTLSSNKHISNLCTKVSNQLNAIGRIQIYMGFKKKEVLLNSFVLSDFNCRPLVWHFCSSKSLKKIEKIQKQTLRKLYNDSTIDYNQLLKKYSKASMEVKHLRTLALEIFKTLNNLNPEYMKEIFYKTTNLTHRPFNIKVNQNNTTKYGNKSLRSLGPHIWNSLPKQIKEETDNKFKIYIDKWFRAKCKCNLYSCLN